MIPNKQIYLMKKLFNNTFVILLDFSKKVYSHCEIQIPNIYDKT